MIVTATDNYGVQYNLSNNPAFVLTEVKGINPPKATINTEAYATADGAVFNSARLQSRNIVLTFYPTGPNVEAGRMALYNIFKTKQKISLTFATGSRTVTAGGGYVESVEVNHYTNPQKIQVSVIVPASYLLGSSTTTPITAGGSASVTNAGDLETGAIFIVYSMGATFSGITYTNTSTGESFSINGYEFQPGDSITIDTRQGSKSVSLGNSGGQTNLLNYFSGDWVKLRTKYANSITFTVDSGTCGGMIIYTPLFEGV